MCIYEKFKIQKKNPERKTFCMGWLHDDKQATSVLSFAADC